MTPRWALTLLCFVLSGLSGLVYQTAWSLEFSLIFGTTDMAIVTVLAAYMAGLSLGASLAGRWAHRMKRPLLTYALLELAIGLAALVMPWSMTLVGRLQTTWFGGFDLPSSSTSASMGLFYVMTSFLMLLIPTALMGATLPLLARWAIRQDQQIAPRIGLLYAANTGGAALGTLVTAFWLLPNLGLGRTVLAAVAINILVFLAAALLARSDHGASELPFSGHTGHPQTLTHRWILPIILVSGFVSFSWEVLWTRLLAHLLGGSLYAFATMLAVFLAGIALGATAISRFVTSRQRAIHLMMVAQGFIGLLSWIGFRAVDFLEPFSPSIFEPDFFLRSLGLVMVLLLPVTLAIGATFPLAVSILAPNARGAATASASVFAWNTIGAIAGALMTGYVILPVLRFATTASLLIAINLILAFLVGLKREKGRHYSLVMATSCLLFLVLLPPTTPWRTLHHSPMGRAHEVSKQDIHFYQVGRGATVLLTEEAASWRLTTNGLPESSISKPWDLPSRFAVARWLSLLPLVIRPETQNQLIIGFGAGITASNLPPSVREIDVIEIEPKVIAANKSVPYRLHQPFDDPRIKVHINDARGALRLTERRFDAIVSQPSHPWTSSSANLFTQEFFQMVKDHLEPEGVFVAWMGLVFTDEALLRTFVATATHVFEHVELYQPKANAIMLVASPSPFDLQETISRGLAAAAPQWRDVGVLTPMDVLSARILTAPQAKAFAMDVAPNRDYDNRFRTRSPKVLANPISRDQVEALFAEFDALNQQTDGLEPAAVMRRLLRRGQLDRAQYFLAGLPIGATKYTCEGLLHAARGKMGQASKALGRALRIDPQLQEARGELLRIRRQAIVRGQPLPAPLLPLSEGEHAMVEGWRLLDAGDVTGLKNLESELTQIPPGHPLFDDVSRLRAQWRSESQNPAKALEGMNLLTPLLGPPPRPRDLLIYARCALGAGKIRESLTAMNYALAFSQKPNLRGLILNQVHSILTMIPDDPDTDLWRQRLQTQLDSHFNPAKP